ncbi:hypothetical protein RIF29_47040 [Crotalaria pallida]|uniref:Uncharacterized protein n=1 Tax=Crotalaria pallida TaxID=3830 RepID=A0AAN9DR57_CROPI
MASMPLRMPENNDSFAIPDFIPSQEQVMGLGTILVDPFRASNQTSTRPFSEQSCWKGKQAIEEWETQKVVAGSSTPRGAGRTPSFKYSNRAAESVRQIGNLRLQPWAQAPFRRQSVLNLVPAQAARTTNNWYSPMGSGAKMSKTQKEFKGKDTKRRPQAKEIPKVHDAKSKGVACPPLVETSRLRTVLRSTGIRYACVSTSSSGCRHSWGRMGEILRSLETEGNSSPFFRETQTDFRILRDARDVRRSWYIQAWLPSGTSPWLQSRAGLQERPVRVRLSAYSMEETRSQGPKGKRDSRIPRKEQIEVQQGELNAALTAPELPTSYRASALMELEVALRETPHYLEQGKSLGNGAKAKQHSVKELTVQGRLSAYSHKQRNYLGSDLSSVIVRLAAGMRKKPEAVTFGRFGCIFSSGLTDCLKKALSLLYQALELTANTGFSSFRFPIPLEHELEKGFVFTPGINAKETTGGRRHESVCSLAATILLQKSQASKEGYHPTVLLVVLKQEKGQTHLTVELTLELIAVGRTGSKSSPLLNLLELERDKRKEKVSASPVSDSEVGCFITSFDVRLASYPVG